MDVRRRGVIVGVDRCPRDPSIEDLRFAERDAQAVYDALTDPATGTFEPAEVRLLLGEAATVPAVKRALREAALAAEPSDVLFVYYAGHGILPTWHPHGDPYLATSDLERTALRDNPDAGLRMGFLRRDVFEVSPGVSFLVLDCCHAGGYLDGTRGSPQRTLRNAFDEMYARELSRHSALLACPADARAREREKLRHGVFTYYLLEGLGGKAAGPEGHVTFGELATYVAHQDITPTPGQFVNGWGPTTVLTRPRVRLAPMHPPIAAPALTISPCRNPLDPYTGSLVELLDRMFRSGHPIPGTDAERLALLRYATEATGAARVEFSDDDHYRVRAASGDVDAKALSGALSQMGAKMLHQRRSALGYVSLEEDVRDVLAVPLYHGETTDALVLVDPARAFLDVDEPFAAVLHAAWQVAAWADPLLAEVRVLTSLRESFGRMPLTLYHRCFQAYQQLLSSVVMAFEPIVSLSTNPNAIGVCGWEALARRNESARSAPIELLDMARPWGDQFLIERDSVLARHAIRGYLRAHTAARSNQAPLPLSINVAVRSLLSDAYADALRLAIQEAGFRRGTVTLEISEQDPIAPAPDEQWLPNTLDFFRERLVALAQRLHVNFAVDDFGVGHASLDRLSNLTLTQIKVDRAILAHELALEELALVVKIAEHALHQGAAARSVVVEGVDGSSKVTLKQIFDTGIHVVQGYITGVPASPALGTLDPSVRDDLANQLRG